MRSENFSVVFDVVATGLHPCASPCSAASLIVLVGVLVGAVFWLCVAPLAAWELVRWVADVASPARVLAKHLMKRAVRALALRWLGFTGPYCLRCGVDVRNGGKQRYSNTILFSHTSQVREIMNEKGHQVVNYRG